MTKKDSIEELETLPNNEIDELIPNENLDKMMQELKKESETINEIEELKTKEVKVKTPKAKNATIKEVKAKTPKIKDTTIEEVKVETPIVKDATTKEILEKISKVRETITKNVKAIFAKVKDVTIKEVKVETPKIKDTTIEEVKVETPKIKDTTIEEVKVETPIVKDATTKEILEKISKVRETITKNVKAIFAKVKDVTAKVMKAKGSTSNESITNETKTESASAVKITDAKVIPVSDKVEKFKLFFVSDMDEEAEYLHKMSLDGYHFQKKNGIRYEFKHEEPKNYCYHLGYYEKDKRDGERYLENYKEAGWVSIYNEKAEFDGVWHYFRSEAGEGEEPSIFSDRGSREALYKRLLTNSRSLLAMVLICAMFMAFVFYFLLTHPSNLLPILLFLCVLVTFAIISTLVVYTHIYRKISNKLIEQKYQ